MADSKTKWMDPDFRRDPKTTRFCVICQRDLKPGQPCRKVRYHPDHYEAVLPSEWDAAGDLSEGLVGMDCARELGLAWSEPA